MEFLGDSEDGFGVLSCMICQWCSISVDYGIIYGCFITSSAKEEYS